MILMCVSETLGSFFVIEHAYKLIYTHSFTCTHINVKLSEN